LILLTDLPGLTLSGPSQIFVLPIRLSFSVVTFSLRHDLLLLFGLVISLGDASICNWFPNYRALWLDAMSRSQH
jgi:hypothetical protein